MSKNTRRRRRRRRAAFVHNYADVLPPPVDATADAVRDMGLDDRPRWSAQPTRADFKTVAVVMLTPGVHAGSAGPLRYTAADLAANAGEWEGMPVVIDHPNVDGRAVHYAAVRDRWPTVGYVTEVRFAEGKLRANAVLSLPLVRDHAPGIAQRIADGQPVEVSTGMVTYTADDQPRPDIPGVTGAPVPPVVTRHIPDHLALLTSQPGACSVAAGCGLGVTNQESAMCTTNCGGCPHNQTTNAADAPLPLPCMYPDADAVVVPPAPAPVPVPVANNGPAAAEAPLVAPEWTFGPEDAVAPDGVRLWGRPDVPPVPPVTNADPDGPLVAPEWTFGPT